MRQKPKTEPHFRTTYFEVVKDNRLLKIARESGSAWNRILDFSDQIQSEHGRFPTLKEVDHFCTDNINRNFLSSQSLDKVYLAYRSAVNGFFEALKAYKQDSSKFNSKPEPPHKRKETFVIEFDVRTIRFSKGCLLLTLKRPHPPIKIKWNSSLPIPITAKIVWSVKFKSWMVYYQFEQPVNNKFLDCPNKILSCDLGVKRIATIFDGENSFIFSGKPLNRLAKQKELIEQSADERTVRMIKYSRRYKKIQRAKARKIKKIHFREQDILRKQSRTIVNYCVEKKINKIVFGDCSSIHDSPNLGRENNKNVVRSKEQQLRKLCSDKIVRVGGHSEVIPEHYTSKTCPVCLNEHKTSTRTFKCSDCGFVFDRDSVGAINIYKRYFNEFKVPSKNCKSIKIHGGLTPPLGYSYDPNKSCSIFRRKDLNILPSKNTMIIPFKTEDQYSILEEPHAL